MVFFLAHVGPHLPIASPTCITQIIQRTSTSTLTKGTQVTVDDWTNTTPHSYEPKQFGYLSETTSHTGYEINAQLDDMTSNHFASIRGDSASVSCTCSGSEYSATTVQTGDVRSVPRTRMHGMTLRSAAFPVEDWDAREFGPVGIFGDIVGMKVTIPFVRWNGHTRNRYISNRRTQGNDSVLKPQTRLAAQTLTAQGAEFRVVEYGAPTEKDELNSTRMQEFATEVEEAMDAQKQLFAQEAGENSDGRKRRLTR